MYFLQSLRKFGNVGSDPPYFFVNVRSIATHLHSFPRALHQLHVMCSSFDLFSLLSVYSVTG